MIGMDEDGIFWYKHNCPHCGHVETGFYDEPHLYDTFTCGLCGHDLEIVVVDRKQREMVCEDMNDNMRKTYEGYRRNR